jgi:hypothetical protein
MLAWAANQMADGMADEAAKRHQFTSADVEAVSRLDASAALALQRLLAVSSYILETQEQVARVPRASLVPLRERIGQAGRDQGHKLVFKAGVACKTCRQHSRLRSAWGWLQRPCPGPGVRHGHHMQTVHGLHFCAVCGQWTSDSRTASTGLSTQCARRATAYGARLLRRLGGKPPLPPPPYHLQVWPDGTALATHVGVKRRRPEPCQPPARSASVSSSGDRHRAVTSPKLDAIRARVLERVRRADSCISGGAN